MTSSEYSSTCFNCKKLIELPEGVVSRAASCPNCASDIRVCYNCAHYDPSSYNECREPQAERVVHKDKGNFCDYFALGIGRAAELGSAKNELLAELNNLFKK